MPLSKMIGDIKVGKHGLSPNIKPTMPIIRTAAKSLSNLKPNVFKKRLFLDSNVISFNYFSQ